MKKHLQPFCILHSAFCISAAAAVAAAADFGAAHACVDPVVLENDYLKITVDRAVGGTARSVIDKADGLELTHEYLTDKGWNGAFGRDRCVEEKGYPAVLQFLKFEGEKTVSPDGVQTLSLSNVTDNARIGKWVFAKTYTLEPNAKRMKITWSVTNPEDGDRWFTPWRPSIVNEVFHDTAYVAKEGVVIAKPGHDFFHYPERNWLTASFPDSGRTLTFTCEWNDLLSQYWCWWSGCHSVEWVCMPRPLKPGATYAVTYWIGSANVSSGVPASVTPDGAASWRFADGVLDVAFSPSRFGTLRIQPRVGGKNFGEPSVVEAVADGVVHLPIPTNGLPKARLMELLIADSPRYFADLGNTLSFSYDIGKDVLTTPQSPWKRPEPSFGRVGSTDVPARKVLDGIYETSPLRKVFKDDRMDDGKFVRDCRLVRGGRFTWSFTVVNTNRREKLSFKIPEGYLTDGRGGVLPFKVGALEWMTIDLPTMFRHDLAVGDYPDPIVPLRNDRFTVPPGENKTFFVMCDVPHDQSPGDYSGFVRLKGAGVERLIPLEATVLGLALPVRSSLRSTAGKWSPKPSVLKAVGYTGTVGEFNEAAKELYARNRVTPREAGIDWWAPEAKLAAQLREAADSGMTMLWIPSAICKNPEGDHMKKAVKVLRDLGLMDVAYDYLIDEPTKEMYPGMIEKVRKLRELYPDLRILATVYAKDVDQLFGFIDIWSRGVKADPWRKERIAKGDEFVTANLAGNIIEDPIPVLVRQFALMKANGVSGFLYWNFICGYGDSNPWERLAVSGSNGGAHTIYPYTTGPIETIRWRAIGWGIELFDLVTILDERAKDGGDAVKAAREAVWTRLRAADEGRDLNTEAELESLRTQILDALAY
jgi:hypothetical protein